MDVSDGGPVDDLVEGLKAGHSGAYERLVREHGDRIYRFVKRLVGERWAEDVTQEVMIRVYRSVASYKPSGRFESWLFAIANNLAIDYARKRRPEVSISELDGELTGESFVSAQSAPLEVIEERERRQVLLRAVERLPADQKQVFLLREEAGLSFKEIAEIAGCPLNTALGRMHYAMENLRRSMKTHGMQ